MGTWRSARLLKMGPSSASSPARTRQGHRHGLDHAPVKGFMARDIITVAPGCPIFHARSGILAGQGIGRVPVVVEHERIVGIVTRKDLLRAEHGDEYLDRRLPQSTCRVSVERFLASVESSCRPMPARPCVTSASSRRSEASGPMWSVGSCATCSWVAPQPRHRRRDRGRRRRVRRGGRRVNGRAGQDTSPVRHRCPRAVAHAARRRHERPDRVLHASGSASHGRALISSPGPASAVTSRSMPWRRASTRTASAR